MASRDVCGQCNSHASVADKEEVRLEDNSQSGCNESTDGKDNQSVGKHLGGLCVGVASVLVRVVDEESGDGDLGTNIT